MNEKTGWKRHSETSYIKIIGPEFRLFAIFRCNGAWAVQEKDVLFQVYPTIAEAKIAAHRMAEKDTTP